MDRFYADLHVHVGISEGGQWIKIPTSNRLTLRNILTEAADCKGLGIVGIVDALSPLVRRDFSLLAAEGLLALDSQGGYRFGNHLTLLLGAEIETSEPDGGTAHTLIYLPDVETMDSFARHMAGHIKNIHMSSQNAHMSLAQLVRTAAPFGALIVPAHVFTPHKSIYGNCTDRLARLLGDREISSLAAIELGLSADTAMADRLSELAGFTFLTNSDAHSLDKIAREYNVLELADPTFAELSQALARTGGRQVAANYGLDPRLGKYHRTFCDDCGFMDAAGRPITGSCPACGSRKVVQGVFDRIEAIADRPEPFSPPHRPPYHHQVPLSFIPGLGKKAYGKLLAAFGTEMSIIHQAGPLELAGVAGPKVADAIIAARSGKAAIAAGGGGVYGKLAKN